MLATVEVERVEDAETAAGQGHDRSDGSGRPGRVQWTSRGGGYLDRLGGGNGVKAVGNDGQILLRASIPPSVSPGSSRQEEHGSRANVPLIFPRQGGTLGFLRSFNPFSTNPPIEDSESKEEGKGVYNAHMGKKNVTQEVEEVFRKSFEESAGGVGEEIRGEQSKEQRRKKQVEDDRARFEAGESVMDVLGRDVAEVFGKKVEEEEEDD